MQKTSQNPLRAKKRRTTRDGSLCREASPGVWPKAQSAKLAGLEPANDLAEVTRRAIEAPVTVTLAQALARS